MEEKQRLIDETYDSVPVPILIIDKAARIEYLNKKAKKIDFFDNSLEKGADFFECFNLKQEQLSKEIQELIKGEKDEFTFADQFKFTLSPTKKERIVVTCLKLAEQVSELKSELLKKDKLLTAVIDTVPDIIGILNPDYSIEEYNQRACQLFSSTAKELKKKKCYQALLRREPCANCPTEKALNKKELIEMEKYVEELDAYYQIRCKPVLNQAGEVIKVVEYLKDITERKKAEESLAERTQLLEGILKSIDGGISVLDSELNIKYVNQTIRDWNLDRLPLTGKKCYQAYHNLDTPCEICPTLQALESGEVATEIIIDERDSELKFFKVSSYPLQNEESAQPMEVVEFIQDVSKQEEQKEKLRAIYQASKDVSFMITELNDNGDDATIVDFSPGAENIFGYSKEEIIGRRVSYLRDEEMLSKFKDIYNELSDEKYWSDRVKLFRKNGESFPALVTVYPLKIYGYKQATLEVTIDISELEATKEELRLNKLAVDKANLGIYRVNQEAKVTYANQHACRQLNYSKQELLGKSVYEIDVNLVEGEMDKVWQDVKQGNVKNRKTYHQTKQGEKIPVQIRIYHIEHNGMDYQYAFVKDISKEEEVKRELKEKNQHLEETRKKLLATNKKLSRQLEKGKEIHHHLLPNSLPSFKSLKMASFYRPAEEIGADFYQTIELDNQILFYISDVTGHNLDGAFLNIFLRESIKAFLTEKCSSGCHISLEEIIEYIIYRYRLENFPDDYFISLALFIIDKGSLELDYLNAGMHINPFLISEQKIHRLDVKGMPVANFFELENYYYEMKSINFSENSTLLITTDGLIEAEKDGVQFGEKRLEKFLESNSQIPLEILLKEIIEDLEAFKKNSDVKDDVTLLALKNQQFIDSLSFEIASKFDLVYQVKAEVREFLTPYHQNVDEILMGLHETLINAIEHGNQQKYNNKIEIGISVTKEAIIIEVEDEGNGFNWREKLKQEFSLDDFGERGRGIMMTKEIFDYFAYNQFGNRAVMYLER